MDGSSRGVLYPGGLPSIHRVPGPDAVSALVRWFWIAEWGLGDGGSWRTDVISYPACNLVVEPQTVGFAGPTSRRSFRDLNGRGWVVGALLRPAGVPRFTTDPGSLLDRYQSVTLPGLHRAVTAAMTSDTPAEVRRDQAVEAYTRWLLQYMPAPCDEALLANTMADRIDGDATVLRIEDAASALGASPRTLQRLARRYVGVTPGAMIRRRRLQEAAELLRTQPEMDIATVAATLGYSDHAHLTRDFRTVLGFTPSDYRRRG